MALRKDEWLPCSINIILSWLGFSFWDWSSCFSLSYQLMVSPAATALVCSSSPCTVVAEHLPCPISICARSDTVSSQMGKWDQVTRLESCKKSAQSQVLNSGHSDPALTPWPPWQHPPGLSCPIPAPLTFLWPEMENRGHDQAHFKAQHISKSSHGAEWLPNRIFLPKIHPAAQLQKSLHFPLYYA